jgi:hypothetical protein
MKIASVQLPGDAVLTPGPSLREERGDSLDIFMHRGAREGMMNKRMTANEDFV